MICFKCNKEIKQEDKKFMYGLDRPYINLFFHEDCWSKIERDIEVYLTQNVDLVYNYIEKQGKKVKNGEKNRWKKATK